METINIQQAKTQSKAILWTTRILKTIMILFLLMDAVMKIIRESHHVEGTTKAGFSDSMVQPIGIILLVCTIAYIIPRTAVMGAILLTAYLGGATVIMILQGEPFFFPVVFGILVWAAIFLGNEKLRSIVPIQRDEN